MSEDLDTKRRINIIHQRFIIIVGLILAFVGLYIILLLPEDNYRFFGFLLILLGVYWVVEYHNRLTIRLLYEIMALEQKVEKMGEKSKKAEDKHRDKQIIEEKDGSPIISDLKVIKNPTNKKKKS